MVARRAHPHWATQHQTELTSTPLSYGASPLSYPAPDGSTLHPLSFAATPLSYAAPNFSTLHPTELRRTTTELPCTPLSYAAPYGAILHPAELRRIPTEPGRRTHWATSQKGSTKTSCPALASILFGTNTHKPQGEGDAENSVWFSFLHSSGLTTTSFSNIRGQKNAKCFGQEFASILGAVHLIS